MLPARDIQILRSVAHYDTLTRAQITRLHFPGDDGRITRKRLKVVLDLGLVNQSTMRVVNPAVSGGTSAPVYYPSAAGMAFLNEGREEGQSRLLLNTTTPNWMFLYHFVAVAETHIALDAAAGLRPDVSVVQWHGERSLLDPKASDPEKKFQLYECVSDVGKPRVVCVPDAGFLLDRGGHRKVFLLEQDRDTTKSAERVAASKCGGYAGLYAKQLHRPVPSDDHREVHGPDAGPDGTAPGRAARGRDEAARRGVVAVRLPHGPEGRDLPVRCHLAPLRGGAQDARRRGCVMRGPAPVRSGSGTAHVGCAGALCATRIGDAAWGCQGPPRCGSSTPGPLWVPRLPLAPARGTLAEARYPQGARAAAPAPRGPRPGSVRPPRGAGSRSAYSPPSASSGEDGRRCSARSIWSVFFPVPTLSMFRFSKLFPRKETTRPVHTLERDGIRLSLTEYPRACEHPGYLVELFLTLGAEDGTAQAALLPSEELQASIALLQEAMAFVNERASMPRCLQTVWLRGFSYYLDERLGELRRRGDPSDRIPLALS